MPMAITCAIASLACGGESRLSEEEYFAEYRELSVETKQFEDAVTESYEDSIRSDSSDELRDAHLALVESTLEGWNLLVDRFSPLNSPASLEDDHARLLESADELVALLTAYRFTISGAGIVQPVDQRTIDEIEAADTAFGAMCRRMVARAQEIGEEAGIECDHERSIGEALSCSAAPGQIQCDPNAREISPGVFGRLARVPVVPEGLVANSQFIELQSETVAPTTILLPVLRPVSEGDDAAFHTYEGGHWTRIAEATVVQNGTAVQGEFSEVPDNIVVLVPHEGSD